jgi:hypothetical protein
MQVTQLPVEHSPPDPQAVLSGALGFVHTPVLELQVPAVWHVVGAGQLIALPEQLPLLWQVSFCVQALLSLQLVPVATAQVAVDAWHVVQAPQAVAFSQSPVVLHVSG